MRHVTAPLWLCRKPGGTNMLSYEQEQAAVRACILKHLSGVGTETEDQVLRVACRGGFPHRAALSSLRALARDGIIQPLTDGYRLVVPQQQD